MTDEERAARWEVVAKVAYEAVRVRRQMVGLAPILGWEQLSDARVRGWVDAAKGAVYRLTAASVPGCISVDSELFFNISGEMALALAIVENLKPSSGLELQWESSEKTE